MWYESVLGVLLKMVASSFEGALLCARDGSLPCLPSQDIGKCKIIYFDLINIHDWPVTFQMYE